jgi:hypothetical protein
VKQKIKFNGRYQDSSMMVKLLLSFLYLVADANHLEIRKTQKIKAGETENKIQRLLPGWSDDGEAPLFLPLFGGG